MAEQLSLTALRLVNPQAATTEAYAPRAHPPSREATAVSSQYTTATEQPLLAVTGKHITPQRQRASQKKTA